MNASLVYLLLRQVPQIMTQLAVTATHRTLRRPAVGPRRPRQLAGADTAAGRSAAAAAAPDEDALERAEHPLLGDSLAGHIAHAQHVVGEHMCPTQRRVIGPGDRAA